MSQPPYQQPPTWGNQHQNWGAPPPQRPDNTPRTALIVIGAIVGFCILGGILIAAISGGGSSNEAKPDKPTAKVPHYEIVEQETSGNTRNIVVEVETTKNLRAVFDKITKGISDEAGYRIHINCSTGGNEGFENRLANGTYAVGRMGSVTTGLPAGRREFFTIDHHKCPDTERAPNFSEARKAGLPPSPGPETRTAYIADLDAIDPDIVHGKEDKAVSRGLNQCSSFKATTDRKKLVALTDYRFTSPDHPYGHGTAIAEQILDVIHERLCPDF
ncbi:hypothetical protein ACWEQC_06775 [Streptomyces shenzhenensis]